MSMLTDVYQEYLERERALKDALSRAEERERVLREEVRKANVWLAHRQQVIDNFFAALATPAPAQPDCPHHHPFRKMTNNGWEFWCEDCGVLIHQPVPSAVNVSATPAHTEGK